MNALTLILAAVLVGIMVLRLVLKRTILRAALKQDVGTKALAKQPDTIHLRPQSGHVWSDPARFAALTEPLRSLGFSEAGTYEIPEMAGTTIAFYAQLTDQVACAIYDHPKVGVWLNFYSHYRDGRRVTASTRPASGLESQPGATTIHAPGTPASALYQRFLRERPAGELEPMTPMNVVARFEAVFASEMAWRKQQGVSAAELARQIDKGPITIHFTVKK